MFFSFIFFNFYLISLVKSEIALDSYTHEVVTSPAPNFQTVQRWYIRRRDSSCVPFEFQGYAKNLNIFYSREECIQHLYFTPDEQLAACEVSNPILVKTTSPPPCHGLFKMRYHYVKKDGNNPGVCEAFAWKGCGGNANNFLSMEDCRNACTKNPKKIPNKFDCGVSFKLSPNDNELENKVIADTKKGMCISVAIGKGTTRGVFNTITQCRNICFPKAGIENPKCTRLPRQGTCIGPLVIKYFYDRSQLLCLPYYTKSCKNEDLINSFDTIEECLGTCPARDIIENDSEGLPKATEMCNQPLDFGIGELKIYQWYFNYKTKTCSPFHYRGIGGNDNRFETKEFCQAACLEVIQLSTKLQDLHDSDEEHINDDMVEFDDEESENSGEYSNEDSDEEIPHDQIPNEVEE